jgi:hypothetical protein
VLVAAAALSAAAQAAPTESLHSLTWHVHEDLIDAGAGRDLAYFQQLIEDRITEAEILVQGHQGPIDTPCCVVFDAVSVTTFSGAGLDIIETEAEIDAVLGGADGGYLVQSVWYCSSFSTTIVGCSGIGGDTFVVSLDAEDGDILPLVIAHERGHNAGLFHVGSDPCELMAGARGGGCLAVSECQSFITKADSSGGTCSCLGDAVGDPPIADATACTDDFGSGLCSGGVCGETNGPADTRLLAAAGTENPDTAATDDALHQSPLAGGWETLGAIGAAAAATGLAYDPGRDVVFAVAPQDVGNDQLVTLDPATGAKTGTVATLSHQDLTALALRVGPRVREHPARDRPRRRHHHRLRRAERPDRRRRRAGPRLGQHRGRALRIDGRRSVPHRTRLQRRRLLRHEPGRQPVSQALLPHLRPGNRHPLPPGHHVQPHRARRHRTRER